jgi:hypothetical protein
MLYSLRAATRTPVHPRSPPFTPVHPRSPLPRSFCFPLTGLILPLRQQPDSGACNPSTTSFDPNDETATISVTQPPTRLSPGGTARGTTRGTIRGTTRDTPGGEFHDQGTMLKNDISKNTKYALAAGRAHRYDPLTAP